MAVSRVLLDFTQRHQLVVAAGALLIIGLLQAVVIAWLDLPECFHDISITIWFSSSLGDQASGGESRSDHGLDHSSDTRSEEESSGDNTGLLPPTQTNLKSFPDASGDRISDREFLERQVNLLKTTFEFDDCPTLSQGDKTLIHTCN